MKREDFEKRFNELYNDRYIVVSELPEEFNIGNNIKCRCLIHGAEFSGRIYRFLNKEVSCPKCREIEQQKKLQEDFIEKSKQKFGDKYDYSLVNYINSNTEVKLICPLHGEFKQTPHTHLHNTKIPCPKCREEIFKKENLDNFIKEATEKHNNYYSYNKVNYIDSSTPVIITCPIHGDFLQTPHSHLTYGCKECTNDKHRLPINEFINRSKNFFGNSFDYSKVNYINNYTKVKLICNDCGLEFEVLPYDHMRGKGMCPNCYDKMKRKTTKEFIKESKKIHGDKYDYTKTTYIDNKSKVIITCPIHGDFLQTPSHHLSGHGCKYCNQISGKPSFGETKLKELFVENNITYISQYYDKNFGRYFFDYYLPEYNLIIEYQGDQHFYFNSFFYKDEEHFLYRIQKDIDKYNYCINKKIKLFYIVDNSSAIEKYDIFNNTLYQGIYNEKNTITDINNIINIIKTEP